jgi:outer membrane cobalamin receptor
MIKKIFFFATFLILVTLLGYTQTDSINIKSFSREQILNLSNEQLLNLPLEDLVYLASKLGITIDELLNQQVTVGSRKQLTPRESPGIITVITREEIIKSGARDLIDVLELVPGIAFGYDVDGVIGLAMRGIWGLEGKILIMIDGQEINEGMYATVNFGSHFSPDQIQKIEIIRGPGSSLYGGYAELGVINIITRNGSDINGLNIYSSVGSMEEAIGHTNVGIQAGQIIGKTEYSIMGFYGTGHRSDADYIDFDGDTFSFKDIYSKYEVANINVGVKNRGFSGRFIADKYTTHITGYQDNATNNFSGMFTGVSYKFGLGKKIEITPNFNYRWQLPYNLEDPDWFYKKAFNRLNGGINMNYDIISKLNLTAGIEYYHDIANDKNDDPESLFYNNKKQISFSNSSAHLQAILKLGPFNIIGGSRLDYHSQAGTNLSPRLGVTAILQNFHFKMLYSKAFRTPSIENLNLNQDILPEKTAVIEFETGYRITSNMFITMNLFDINIKDPIIYKYNPDTEEEFYLNYSKTGSQGIELQFNTLFTRFQANLDYSYYNSKGKNKVDLYEVHLPDDSLKDEVLQGMPSHKFSISAVYNFTEKISLSSTFTLWGKRYGFINNDTLQSSVGPTPNLNFFFNYKNLFIKDLSVGFGIYNVLDKEMLYIQPYGSEGSVSAPYPGATREYLIKVSYTFGMRKDQ